MPRKTVCLCVCVCVCVCVWLKHFNNERKTNMNSRRNSSECVMYLSSLQNLRSFCHAHEQPGCQAAKLFVVFLLPEFFRAVPSLDEFLVDDNVRFGAR